VRLFVEARYGNADERVHALQYKTREPFRERP
jgi:hypothetical protein